MMGGPGGPGGASGPKKSLDPSQPYGGPMGAPQFASARQNFDDPAVRKETIDKIVNAAKFYKTLGFQMLTTRESQSSKAHIDFCVELAEALKGALGSGFPLEFYTDGIEAGISVEHNLELARALEGKIDILTVRYGVQDWTHPTGYTSTRTHQSPCTELAGILTKDAHDRNAKLKIGISAGLHDPAFCESLLENDGADVIVMARTWICEPDYMQKLVEGRGEDVVPCVRCNKCHVPNDTDKFRSFCTVNPKLGLEDKIDRMIKPVTKIKNVAVVGGGPGGMYAAMTLADRGHKVTLYEKEAVLGGQLVHADYPKFKWPLADYKNWLAMQCYKKGVNVLLNTRATKELLQAGNYDHVIVAVGAIFPKIDIPGADLPNVMVTPEVYGIIDKLPKTAVIIGGSETGAETGMYLAENGIEVTVMCRQATIASDAAHAHYRDMAEEYWNKLPCFHQVTSVQKYIAIEPDGVRYIDAEGNEQKVLGELVVMCTGAKPNNLEAAALAGAAPQTDYIGDCRQVGNVHFAVTSGYGAANQI